MPDPDGGLLQSLQGPPQGFGAQLGAGLQSLAAGYQGLPDPQEARFKQQLELIKLQQTVQNQRMRKAQLGIDLYRDILTDPRATKEAQGLAAKGWAEALQGIGVSVDPALTQAFSNRRVSLNDVEKIGASLARGVPSDMIRQEFPTLTSGELSAATAISQNPQFLRANHLKTLDEQKREAAEAQLKDLDLLFQRYGIHGDSPRSQMIRQQAISKYGQSFGELTESQRRDLLKATEGMGTPKTTLVKNALAEMGLNSEQVQDPRVIQEALTRHTARVKKDALDLAANRNQLTAVGGMYRKALIDSQQDFSRLARVESLERDMIRLIQEGRALGLTGNSKIVNAAQQELASWTASGGKGKLTRQADWVRRFGIVDAQFAIVAQAFERITGNRLAQQLATLARGFHPKISDPYEVQKGVVLELHKKLKENRTIATQDLARAQNQYDQVLKLTGASTHLPLPDEAAVEDLEDR